MNEIVLGAGVLTGFLFFAPVRADEAIASVRAERTDSNAVLAAHDSIRLRQPMLDDYNMFGGNSGFIENAFNDPMFVT